MKTIRASLSLHKHVDAWGPDGAEGKGRFVDSWNGSTRGPDAASLKLGIADFLETYGLAFDKFEVFDTDDNDASHVRFTFNQTEDNEGSATDDGQWLADYDLCVRFESCEPIAAPDFGLPHC